MPDSKDESQLRLVLENALILAPPDASILAIAERVYDSEPQLMARLRRPWMVERIVRMLGRRQSRQIPEKQLPIPGFEELPRRIVTTKEPPAGKTKPRKIWLKDATLQQLLEYRKVLVKLRDVRLEDLDKLIAFMRAHVGKRRKVTVGMVVAEQEKFQFEDVRR